jgi:hypothetical protein
MRERTERIPIKNIQTDPGLTPPHDPMLDYLLEGALKGNVPVFFAAIPLKIIKPFSDQYDPRRHPIGKQAVAMIQEQWKAKRFKNMLVYPKDDAFVMSDDYVTYYACLEGKADYVPCWVFGRFTSPHTRDVQGPIAKEDLRKALFGSND